MLNIAKISKIDKVMDFTSYTIKMGNKTWYHVESLCGTCPLKNTLVFKFLLTINNTYTLDMSTKRKCYELR